MMGYRARSRKHLPLSILPRRSKVQIKRVRKHHHQSLLYRWYGPSSRSSKLVIIVRPLSIPPPPPHPHHPLPSPITTLLLTTQTSPRLSTRNSLQNLQPRHVQ